MLISLYFNYINLSLIFIIDGYFKNMFLLVALLFGYFCIGQTMTTEQWNKMRDEAFLNYIQNGGTTDGFMRNSDKIIQDYIKKTTLIIIQEKLSENQA